MDSGNNMSSGQGRGWSWGIVAAYLLFAATTLGFVAFSFSQRVDLVSRDYYQRETDHQQQIDRVERTGMLPDGIAWSMRRQGEQILFQFPQDQVEGKVEGSMHLYRPSNASLDRKLIIKLDANGQQSLAANELEAGLWRVKISWSLGAEEYYSEFAFVME